MSYSADWVQMCMIPVAAAILSLIARDASLMDLVVDASRAAAVGGNNPIVMVFALVAPIAANTTLLVTSGLDAMADWVRSTSSSSTTASGPRVATITTLSRSTCSCLLILRGHFMAYVEYCGSS